MTRIPENTSCEKLETFDIYCWNVVERLLISTLSLKIAYDNIGSGSNVYKVRRGETLYIYTITMAKRMTVLMVYITAGPTYIRVFPTSSLMRFIRSPVRFCL